MPIPRGSGSRSKAVALLEPIATAPDASLAARRALADALAGLGFIQQQHREELEAALTTLSRARDISAALGAREIKSPDISALYLSAAVWEGEVLSRLGHEDQARALAEEADALGERVLKIRPDYLGVLHDTQVLEIDLAMLANGRMDPATAIV